MRLEYHALRCPLLDQTFISLKLPRSFLGASQQLPAASHQLPIASQQLPSSFLGASQERPGTRLVTATSCQAKLRSPVTPSKSRSAVRAAAVILLVIDARRGVQGLACSVAVCPAQAGLNSCGCAKLSVSAYVAAQVLGVNFKLLLPGTLLRHE